MVEDEGVAPIVNFGVAVQGFGENGISRVLLPDNQVFVTDGGPLFGEVAGGFSFLDAGVEDQRLAPGVGRSTARKDVFLAGLK